jgi:hypothetical protein
MPNSETIKDFIEAVKLWAASKPDVHAVALVGSYARGAAGITSDIDLVIILDDPRGYLENTNWLQSFGMPDRQQLEDYGSVTSLRVWFRDGKEVEFGLTTPAWIKSPLDEGTWQTIRDGILVVFEREPTLSPLLTN